MYEKYASGFWDCIDQQIFCNLSSFFDSFLVFQSGWMQYQTKSKHYICDSAVSCTYRWVFSQDTNHTSVTDFYLFRSKSFAARFIATEEWLICQAWIMCLLVEFLADSILKIFWNICTVIQESTLHTLLVLS